MTDTEGFDEEITAARARLAGRLRDLRRAADLTGEQLAERCGWNQSKVSRVETGRTVPQVGDVRVWADAVNAGPNVRGELEELAEVALTATSSWQRAHQRGLRRNQLRYARMEQAASTIRIYQTSVVPGLLQIPEYARRVITLANPSGQVDVAEAVAARMERQNVLYTGKPCEFIITEPVLYWRPGPPELLLAQLDRLVTVSTLPNVELGILPHGEANELLNHPFVMYGNPGEDDAVVIVETIAGEETVHDVDKLKLYLDQFNRYRAAAVYGADARALISRIASELTSTQ